jgi:hypothetical protein
MGVLSRMASTSLGLKDNHNRARQGKFCRIVWDDGATQIFVDRLVYGSGAAAQPVWQSR